MVRCQTFPGKEYTVPPAPKCPTRNMFLPENPSYQDIWQWPLLLTLAYAWGLQYWAEKFRLPTHPDYHPWVMSIMELMHTVKEHIIFYKQDILCGLGRIVPDIVGWDLAVPWGHPITQPTTTDIRGMESKFTEVLEKHGTTPHYSDLHIRRRSHQSNLLPHLLHTPPALVGSPPEGHAMVLPTESKMGDWLTDQDVGFIGAMTWIVPTMASAVKLTSPITPSDQTEEEKQYMLVMTALVRRLNLKTTGVVLRDMVTTSAGGLAFWNPWMAAVLPGPIRGRRAIDNWGIAREELARRDAEWEHDWTL